MRKLIVCNIMPSSTVPPAPLRLLDTRTWEEAGAVVLRYATSY